MDNIPDMDDLLDSLECHQSKKETKKLNPVKPDVKLSQTIDCSASTCFEDDSHSISTQKQTIGNNFNQIMEDAEQRFYMNFDEHGRGDKLETSQNKPVSISSEQININSVKSRVNNDEMDAGSSNETQEIPANDVSTQNIQIEASKDIELSQKYVTTVDEAAGISEEGDERKGNENVVSEKVESGFSAEVLGVIESSNVGDEELNQLEESILTTDSDILNEPDVEHVVSTTLGETGAAVTEGLDVISTEKPDSDQEKPVEVESSEAYVESEQITDEQIELEGNVDLSKIPDEMLPVVESVGVFHDVEDVIQDADDVSDKREDVEDTQKTETEEVHVENVVSGLIIDDKCSAHGDVLTDEKGVEPLESGVSERIECDKEIDVQDVAETDANQANVIEEKTSEKLEEIPTISEVEFVPIPELITTESMPESIAALETITDDIRVMSTVFEESTSAAANLVSTSTESAKPELDPIPEDVVLSNIVQDEPAKIPPDLSESSKDSTRNELKPIPEDVVLTNIVPDDPTETNLVPPAKPPRAYVVEAMPVSFDETTELTAEEELELQKELDEMSTENVPDPGPEDDDDGGEEEAAKAPEQSTAVAQDPPPANEKPQESVQKASVILSTHDLSYFNDNPFLTESEMELGKTKPFWIPDEDCTCCMLCTTKFTVLNRRHHCRCCGRVLCNPCCSVKRTLAYISDSDKKQKVCEPCSKTLDRIEEYEARQQFLQTTDNSPGRHASSVLDIPGDTFDQAGPSTGSLRGSSMPGSLRKKSVLKSKKSETAGGNAVENVGSLNSDRKRSVKFLDGVNPGHEDDAGPSGGGVGLNAAWEDDSESARRKTQKRQSMSKRNRERKIEEEQASLIKDDCLYVADCDSQVSRVGLAEICRKLVDGERLTLAIKKNFWVVAELTKTLTGKVWSFSTRGMAAIGADEMMLAFESSDSEIKHLEDVIQFFELKKDEINVEYPKQTFIHSLLYLFEHFFLESLMPASENLDEKVGIRKCGSRMAKFYRILSAELFEGFNAAAVLFHRPQGQDLSNYSVPQHVPFLIGILVMKQELAWALSIPNRLLLRIGMQSSHFPVSVVNKRNRPPVYTDCSDNTVLKVFNDFRNWSYRLPRILGSTVEIEGGCVVKVCIPKFGTDELKQVIESNRNMLAWCTELTDHPDSHLVAIQNAEDNTFRTEIFTDVGGTRQTIGANFIVIDGSLKNSSEKFSMTIIEDGVVLKFSVEKMEEIVRNLQAGMPFSTNSESMSVEIVFADPREPETKLGALVSPIDGMYLLGHYQYGLTLPRQFRSQIVIPNITEWALRLSSVINADPGKFPLQLQPRYFEICEQIGARIAMTVEQFIRALTLSEQRQLCIRVRIEPDIACYETVKWPGFEQEHRLWTSILDDKLIPYLYQLCPMVTTQLYIELYFSIISTRLLQNIDY